MKKVVCLILLLICLLMVFSGCAKYDPDDFIGLTSAEVIEKYGAFDVTRDPASEDGLYRDTFCGYILKEARKGNLGTTTPLYFVIYFDEFGTAYKCGEMYFGEGGWTPKERAS